MRGACEAGGNAAEGVDDLHQVGDVEEEKRKNAKQSHVS